MWIEYMTAPNLATAEMWKDTFEGEGLAAKIMPEGEITDWAEQVSYKIYVPKGREHVADEILRKL